MSDKEFERKQGPVLGLGVPRGPATAEPLSGGPESGLPALVGEHRGTLADAESDVLYRWAAPAVAGKRVLDVGCGTGVGTELLRRAGAAGVLGSDHDRRAIEIATRQFAAAGGRFLVAEASALPLTSASFEVVICSRQAETSPDTDGLLGELRRLLAPGGLLFVSLPVDEGSDWLAHASLQYSNRKLFSRRASLAATIVADDAATESDDEAGEAERFEVGWLGADPAERRSVLLLASDGELPDLAPTATLTGGRDLYEYRETVDAWEQRARMAEADGAAKHWELVASREAQRRLRKRLWHLEHRPLRRIFRVLTGQPWKLSEGPPIRPPERGSEPWS